ncbi:thioredoxin domain-containing protein [Streptomyces sp. P10-4]|uniref:thioredoxin domain-containing protein n=1 Tax=Streptomyces sp. P10-4 TaxID=3421645 RepID=UPI003D279025
MMRRGFAAAVAVAVMGLSATGCGGGQKPSDDAKGDRPKAGAKADAEIVADGDYAGPEDLPERLAADGTTIVVGDPDAPVAVRLYEDPRCPVCEEFEVRGGAPELRRAAVRREARIEYVLASFLDDRVGGSGSKKAVNALRAALDAGKFAEYHDVLYAHQPEVSVDGFTDAYLLKLAGRVEGLRGPAFDSAVKTMKYRSFVTAAEKAYERAGGAEEPGGPGTPTADINGVRIPAEYNGVLFDPEVFGTLLTRIRKDPEGWKESAF